MVFIVKGKHDVVTYFVVLAMVIDLELVIWLQLLISLMENSTNKETGSDYFMAWVPTSCWWGRKETIGAE